MTASIVTGQTDWRGSRDDEGHREYHIVHKVRCAATDGPNTIMNATGLPTTGSEWDFDGDSDPWAFCTPYMRVTPAHSDEPNTLFAVERKFTTKPRRRCQDTPIEDPLLEPDRISGTFVKYTKEVTQDRNGDEICSSSFELIHGPQVEFDHNRPTVRIEQNVIDLELDVVSEMVDTLNDAELWGLAARKIKLSNFSWERLLYGTCNFYFTRVLDFDVRFDTFDRTILDEGTRVLKGEWSGCDTDPVWTPTAGLEADNPQHYERFQDCKGNPIPRVILDGNGNPWDGTGTDGPGTIDVEYYDESDFFLLAIPATL